MQPRQRAPGAADGVKCAPFARFQQRQLIEGSLDDLLGFFERAPGQVLQREAAERQRDPAADARAVYVDQFERAAAEIADDAVRLVDAGDDAERRELRLAAAGEDGDLGAADALRFGDEGLPVARVAAGGGGD